MSLNRAPQTVSAETYQALFEKERIHVYPQIDALEQRLRVAADRDRLEAAARVLSCPFKAAEPNWQHGRVIYAVVREYVESNAHEYVGQVTGGLMFSLLDIGTAKGFSALCAQWALDDAGRFGIVTSLDVMDPLDRVRRNTIAEVDGLKTLPEILAPWPEADRIRFEQVKAPKHMEHRGACSWLMKDDSRIYVAYVDGKHTYDAVSWESAAIARRQHSGDVIIFDDFQVPGIAKAIHEMRGYDLEYLASIPGKREYVIARKR